jgi:hypothetical protein
MGHDCLMKFRNNCNYVISPWEDAISKIYKRILLFWNSNQDFCLAPNRQYINMQIFIRNAAKLLALNVENDDTIQDVYVSFNHLES